MEKTDVRTLKSIHCTSVTWLQLHRQITPPLPKKIFSTLGGGVLKFCLIGFHIQFTLNWLRLPLHDIPVFISNSFPSFLWPDQYWWIYITQVERASSGRLCLCLQRLSRPPHCRAIIISPLSISDPMGQVAYGFPRYLILNEWLYLNGTQPNTYSVYQWQVMCMQVTNVNILCSDWELFETGRAPAVTVSSYQGSTDKADTIAQTGHLHLQSPDTTQHNTANGLTI